MTESLEMYDGKPVFLAANSKELARAVKKYEGKAEAPYVVRWSGKTRKVREEAFCHDENLGVILLPDSVTTIGDMAFAYCRNLSRVVIPGSVTTIKRRAFDGCTSLPEVVIPDSVSRIEEYTFGNCSS